MPSSGNRLGGVLANLRFSAQLIVDNAVAWITRADPSILPSGNSKCHHPVRAVASWTTAAQSMPSPSLDFRKRCIFPSYHRSSDREYCHRK
jgi:hypothetical protein